jgi:hypothetical protein
MEIEKIPNFSLKEISQKSNVSEILEEIDSKLGLVEVEKIKIKNILEDFKDKEE